MRRAFVTADVFTTTKGAGNPLAVVLDCAGLSDAQMQMIAREFNISETTFVLLPKAPDRAAFVRIFTPARELPFAGHPVIGTAVVLAERHRAQSSAPLSRMVLEVPLGVVDVEIGDDPRGATSATCAIPKLPVMHSPSPTAAQVAAALSLPPADIAADRAIETWDAGYAVVFAALKSPDAVSRARVDLPNWPSAAQFGRATSIYPYAVTGNGRFYARMFAPTLGIPEDPATGGAVAALAGHLHACAALGDGLHHATIEQGVDMGRPSQINLEMQVAQGQLKRVRIGGSAVQFLSGSFEL
ncbi:MAG: PhzF family phenazine biosynthesis protein [Xanthobacteraceae bacterium]